MASSPSFQYDLAIAGAGRLLNRGSLLASMSSRSWFRRKQVNERFYFLSTASAKIKPEEEDF